MSALQSRCRQRSENCLEVSQTGEPHDSKRAAEMPAVDGKENQKQVSHRRPRALGNCSRDFHIPAAPTTTAMGKRKSTRRIPTFPQRLPVLSNKSKAKGDQPQPETLSFRLISGLEYAQWYGPEVGITFATAAPRAIIG